MEHAGARPTVLLDRPLLPLGFAAGATKAGIKASGRPDLAIVAVTTPEPAAAAGTFTQNRVAAAPVRLSRSHLASTGGRARGVIVTAGCANAATGAAGDADQAEVAALFAGALGCAPAETLLASTGLIGTRLPLARVAAGIASLAPARLRGDGTGLAAAAAAIMTTDRRPKLAAVRLELPGADGQPREVVVSGFSKGVGMIHPDMATMIAVLLTDAAVAPGTLDGLLQSCVDETFNMLTVDGDTSTNDTALALASGAAGAAPVTPGSPGAAALGLALTAVCRSLARQQAADGEGATTLLTCLVRGAADRADARAVARAVAGSSLVKAAVYGRDPNWGRIAAAAGRARRLDGRPVALDPERLRVAIGGTTVFAGLLVAFDADAVRRAMAPPEAVVEVDLGLGESSAEAWGCDLTEGYVRENAEYST